MRRLSRLILCLTLLPPLSTLQADTTGIRLNQSCPAGFEQLAGKCYFRNLYRLYPSLQNAGVGGLKTGLPEPREGFTPEQIDLGRYLFFDPLLSADSTLSCASCHHPDFGFSDGRDRSVGINGRKVARSSPSLWNVTFLKRL
ncbi:MAG: cytochrome-c peroxidase, partial [Pseudomonadales bacterium]